MTTGGKGYFQEKALTLIAYVDLSSYQYHFVKTPGSGATYDRYVTYAAAAGDLTMGILGNKPDAKDLPALVFQEGWGCLKLGGTVNPGDLLTSDGTGGGVKSTADADFIGATALEYGVAGDLINVRITAFQTGGTH